MAVTNHRGIRLTAKWVGVVGIAGSLIALLIALLGTALFVIALMRWLQGQAGAVDLLGLVGGLMLWAAASVIATHIPRWIRRHQQPAAAE